MPGSTIDSGAGFARTEIPPIPPKFSDDTFVLFGRISSLTKNGAALIVTSDYGFGEAIELRYTSSLVNTQFQGLYVEVRTAVANTSTIRGAEFKAARDAAVAVGTIEGLIAEGFVRVAGTGNVGALYGIGAEAQIASGYTGTIALLAAVRAKIQSEGTITEGYGVYIFNEAVNAGVKLTAAIGIKATAGLTAYEALIDASGTTLAVNNTDQVTLIAFKDSAGNAKKLVYDVSAATVVVV